MNAPEIISAGIGARHGAIVACDDEALARAGEVIANWHEDLARPAQFTVAKHAEGQWTIAWHYDGEDSVRWAMTCSSLEGLLDNATLPMHEFDVGQAALTDHERSVITLRAARQ